MSSLLISHNTYNENCSLIFYDCAPPAQKWKKSTTVAQYYTLLKYHFFVKTLTEPRTNFQRHYKVDTFLINIKHEPLWKCFLVRLPICLLIDVINVLTVAKMNKKEWKFSFFFAVLESCEDDHKIFASSLNKIFSLVLFLSLNNISYLNVYREILQKAVR